MPYIAHDQVQRLKQQCALVERFAQFLTDHDDTNDVLHMLTDQAAAAVGVMGAGVTLAQRTGYVCVSPAIPAISDLERIVEQTQAGPSIDAAINERPVAITDLAVGTYAQRWPTFVAQAKASSIQSVVALPMIAHGHTLGALEMYDDMPRKWMQEDTTAIRILVHIASVHIDLATKRDHEHNVVDQLQHALTSRIDIEQAKGVLAGRFGYTTDKAFEILRRTARNNNRLLRDVCRQVVDPYRPPPFTR
jgi:GAF domain-containing protein